MQYNYNIPATTLDAFSKYAFHIINRRELNTIKVHKLIEKLSINIYMMTSCVLELSWQKFALTFSYALVLPNKRKSTVFLIQKIKEIQRCKLINIVNFSNIAL